VAAPLRKIIVDTRAPEPNWKMLGPAQVFTQRIYFSQFASAATTVNLDLLNFPGHVVIEGAWFLFNVNWTGGAVASATLSAGTTGSPTLYVAATSVFSGATLPLPLINVGVTQVPGTYLGTAATPGAFSTIRIQLVVAGANANALTAGQADFFVRLRAMIYRQK
jgi:hypothetical protein